MSRHHQGYARRGFRDLAGFDAVIHLAALSNDPLGNINPDLTHSINHIASVGLAKAAKAAGVGRFLLPSCARWTGVMKSRLSAEV